MNAKLMPRSPTIGNLFVGGKPPFLSHITMSKSGVEALSLTDNLFRRIQGLAADGAGKGTVDPPFGKGGDQLFQGGGRG